MLATPGKYHIWSRLLTCQSAQLCIVQRHSQQITQPITQQKNQEN